MKSSFVIYVVCCVIAFLSYQVLLQNDNVFVAGIAIVFAVIGGLAMTVFFGKLGGVALEKLFGKNKISNSWKN